MSAISPLFEQSKLHDKKPKNISNLDSTHRNKTMQRFKALDVFRGMTICLMIVVNTPGTWKAGHIFAPFLHR